LSGIVTSGLRFVPFTAGLATSRSSHTALFIKVLLTFAEHKRLLAINTRQGLIDSRFFLRPASRTAVWWIDYVFTCVKLLFTDSEYKCLTAITAIQGYIA
jgi:hypothetical protein